MPTSQAVNDRGGPKRRGAAGRLEALLLEIEAEWQGSGPARVSLGILFDRMGETAFGLLLLLFALPCCVPFIYGVPQIVSFPMLILAGQMAMGRHSPWLPEKLRNRDFSVSAALNSIRWARRYLDLAEWFARPRFLALSGRSAARVTGALLVVPVLSILVPFPLTNTVPGISIAVVSIGLLERDGLFVLGGLLVGLTWVAALVIGGQAAIGALIHLVQGWIA